MKKVIKKVINCKACNGLGFDEVKERQCSACDGKGHK